MRAVKIPPYMTDLDPKRPRRKVAPGAMVCGRCHTTLHRDVMSKRWVGCEHFPERKTNGVIDVDDESDE